VATDNDKALELLLRDRLRKLESTLHAYDNMLDTRAVDRMRKRNQELERLFLDMLRGNELSDARRRQIEVTLGNKFPSGY
jgi:hypothetical protein